MLLKNEFIVSICLLDNIGKKDKLGGMKSFGISYNYIDIRKCEL